MFASNGIAMNNIENNFHMPSRHDTINQTVNNLMEINDSDKSDFSTDLANLKVTVGIDEDLQMILEMDPSIVDLVRTLFHTIPNQFKLKVSSDRSPKQISNNSNYNTKIN